MIIKVLIAQKSTRAFSLENNLWLIVCILFCMQDLGSFNNGCMTYVLLTYFYYAKFQINNTSIITPKFK